MAGKAAIFITIFDTIFDSGGISFSFLIIIIMPMDGLDVNCNAVAGLGWLVF